MLVYVAWLARSPSRSYSILSVLRAFRIRSAIDETHLLLTAMRSILMNKIDLALTHSILSSSNI